MITARGWAKRISASIALLGIWVLFGQAQMRPVAAGPIITVSNAATLQPVQRLGRGFLYAVTWLPGSDTVALAGSIGVWVQKPGSEPLLLKTPSSVSTIDASPDGSLLALGLTDGSVRLYDLKTNKLSEALYLYDTGVLKVRFSPDGRLLASSGGDKPSARVIVLDVATAGAKRELTARAGAYDLAFSPDGKMLAYQDIVGQLVLYDLETDHIQATLKELGEVVSVFAGIGSLAFSPRGDMIAVGKEADGYVLIWDVKKEEVAAKLVVQSVGINKMGILDVAFSPDGKYLVAGVEAAHSVHFWDTRTWQEQPSILDYDGSLSLSSDGKRLAILTTENAIQVVNMETRTEVSLLDGYRSSLFSASFPVLVGQQQVITYQGLNTIQVWDLAGNNMQSLASPVTLLEMTLSADGHLLAAGGVDGNVYLWELPRATVRPPIKVMGARKITGLAFNQDGTRLAVGTETNIVLIFSATGDLIKQLKGTQSSRQAEHMLIAFSPDDTRVWACTRVDDNFVTWLWDYASGQRLNLWTSYGAAFSADGQRLALVDKGGNIHLQSMSGKAGKLIRTDLGSQESAIGVTFSPDGSVLALLPQDYRSGNLSLWDTSQSRAAKAAPCKWVPTPISSSNYLKRLVAFSNDGTVLACASTEDPRAIVLWDVAQQKILTTLRQHSSFLLDLSFSTDGRFLLSGGSDGVVYFWGLN